MLLRRITKHVTEQNWFAVFIDFLIVVVGVFIGIQVANWNDDRKLLQKEQQILKTLQEDFLAHEKTLIERTERAKRLRDDCVELRELTRANEDPQDKKMVKTYIVSCLSTSWGRPPPASYTELMESGSLSLLSSKALRKAIIEYGQANALWRNVSGRVEAQNSEHSKFRQAIKIAKNEIDVPREVIVNSIEYDWELMQQADVSIGTVVRMHSDQYHGHQRDLTSVKKILEELDKEE